MNHLWKRWANRPTSTRIALQFTIYVITVVLFFALVANGLFFRQWYTREKARLAQPDKLIENILIRGGKRNLPPLNIIGPVQTLPRTPLVDQYIQEHTLIGSIVGEDGQYVLYQTDRKTIRFVDISRLVEAQMTIGLVSLGLLLGFSLLTFWLSQWIVRSGLSRLYLLNESIDRISRDNLSPTIPLHGPASDEIRKVAQTLRTSLEMISRHAQSLTNFVGHASHELRTPLMQISSALDIMSKQTTGDQSLIDRTKQTIKRMNSLITDLLTLVSLEATDTTIRTTAHDIVPYTRELVEHYQAVCHDKGLTLVFDTLETVVLPIHAHHRELIVRNLLDNAVTYTDTGQIDVVLTQTQLTVRDTGQGIATEDLEHIRETFWQADESKSQTHHAGLGLALVKKIIGRYGRSVQVDSVVGQGTSFVLKMG